ncbi:MAG: hypothetical protein A2151_04575 [Candidatus Muproteobacteria bacterium RBG_16_65_34]|uniref:Anti sigma-E protein RseA N-terminal domain-containing protein n=1 Tax=Candidatus Muproteobacteria bacterium RBG_16_65_34 TaxID=1817760 RepID=A0A1F6TLE5_9PROT|nr:MAG: hypothetical protein A2151_04575 [Candidatus Muproteobacteria bacterium RBG_16_65_34]
MKEHLSALMDNELDELSERRLHTQLASDADLRQSWERYHLARAALRGELEEVAGPMLAERIHAAVEAEKSGRGTRRLAPALKLAGGAAIAASVAVVAILGLQTQQQPPERVAAKPAATVVAEARKGDPVRAGVRRWDTREPEAESALNAYLVEHNEFAPTSGMNGMLPYVRVVGYDSDK